MIEIPPSFRAMPRWWHDGTAWLDSLPDRIDHQLRRWQLTVDGPARHGSNALVLPVRRDDEPLALRFAPPADAVDDLVPLRFWAGRGTVALVAHDPDAGALLLERLDPGRSLRDEPLEVAAEQLGLIMATLAVPVDPTTISTHDLVAARTPELSTDWDTHGRPFARSLLDQVIEISADLSTGPADLAVNGDLHHDQVLAGTRAPWLCVDAKLLRGDRTYDLARCLWTRLDEAGDEMIMTQLVIMAAAAGTDVNHARRAALYRTVDYWLWGLGHGLTEDPVRCARLAEILLTPVGSTRR